MLYYTSNKMDMLLATSSLSKVLRSLVPKAGHTAQPQLRSVAGRVMAPKRPMP